jgi:predicted PhzF superfamily epimerase YddE/YHI9
MDRAPSIPPAQAAALRRASELVVELNAVVASVRAHLNALEAAHVAPPALPPTEDTALAPGELRAAFGAARDATPARSRPRWAETLLDDA